MNKKNIGNIKLLNQIKIYLWNNITPLYIHYLFVILLVFITAEQDIIYSY